MSGSPPSISALVLAGGAARRLGGRKADREVGGRTMLASGLAAAAAVSDDVLLMPGARLLPGPDPAGVRRLPDPPGRGGPLAALGAGLRAARHDWVVLLPCDLPFVSPALLRRLAAEAAPGVDVVAVRTADGLQPFPALYGAHLAPLVDERLTAGVRALRALLDVAIVRELPAGEAEATDPGLRSLVNVNTPADLAAARAEARP